MQQNQNFNEDHLVELRDVSFRHGDHVVFDKINLTIPRGKITAVMGPSGTGKTTLLRLIGAQLKPRSGKVFVNGINMHRLPSRKLYAMRRQMGMLFQNGALFTDLSVYENVAFPLREHTQLPEDMLRDLVLIKLEEVGLRGTKDLMPNQLSGGMAHRVALARALALDPELMMYDEPFTGQDPITMAVLVNLIKRLNESLGLTSIIVSHDVAETAAIADYIYVIADGKIMGQGTSAQIFADETAQVKQFIHGLPDGVVPFHYPAINYAEDLDLC